MSFTPMAISSSREVAQDFTKLPYYHEYSTIAYKRLSEISKLNIYLKPFKPEVGSSCILYPNGMGYF